MYNSHLRNALEAGRFCITGEIVPPLSADRAIIIEEVSPLIGQVEAVNVTDGAGARTTMSSLMASAILVEAGIEPVLQLTCRDRNRIALCADLIGASALGIHNLLPLAGDDPARGDQPDAVAVHDLDTIGLIRLAVQLSEQGQTPSGRAIHPPPEIFVGAADVPHNEPDRVQRLQAKVEAGARFVQTQLCYDLALIREYIDILGNSGVLDHTSILIGLGPIASARSAVWMREHLWGVAIPDALVSRLEDAPEQKPEGRKICLELIAELEKIDGIAGVHLMAPGQHCRAISDLIHELKG